jgi:hypothetical protein
MFYQYISILKILNLAFSKLKWMVTLLILKSWHDGDVLYDLFVSIF